ncbi:MAG: zinc-binding dehydrogenase [Gammaproteobacteria bacterium]|nr:zinc-binding dehydrogenase [Gammaproteobacteria bacterium]
MKTKAAVLYEMGLASPYAQSQPLQIEELELAPPGATEVLVEVGGAGLCHSDLSVIDGSRPRVMPMVMGHEASGIVRDVGSSVSNLRVGDHVVFSFMPACGHCVTCASGRPVMCDAGANANASGALLSGERRFVRSDRTCLHHHLGVSAFSEYTVAAQESVVKIDPELPLEIAALFGCAVMTGVGAVFNTAGVQPGRSCAVFGMGGVGLSAIMGARAAGAYPTIAVDVLDAKLAIAKEVGATHTINALQDDPVEAIGEITGGGAAYTIEGVGSETALVQAYHATARGGTTVTVGLPHPKKLFSIPAVSLVADEKTVKGSYMGSAVPARDLPRFIAMYQAGLLPVDKLLTSTITLDQINAAFDALARGDAVRQVITFN